MSYTYAILKVSAAVYDEVRSKLILAGYEDQLHASNDGEVIDMHGIALSPKDAK